MYDGRRGGWARELGILREGQKPAPFDGRAIGNKLFPFRNDVRVALGRRALLQNSCGPTEYDEAARGALASGLGSLDAAKKSTPPG
jgi:hypothetical protein